MFFFDLNFKLRKLNLSLFNMYSKQYCNYPRKTQYKNVEVLKMKIF